jgi:hypothetical protein
MGSGMSAVQEDWLAQLTEEKGTLFGSSVMHLETSYGMLSVALNEAFVLREEGMLVRARAETAICGQLCGQLAQRLLHSLQSFEAHTRHFGTVPAVAPLETTFFRSEQARLAATWNELFHHVLLGGRARWFHKLRTLEDVVGGLESQFCAASEEIADGTCLEPALRWESLDVLHFDLNTCLRETIVMLKCFLRALPHDQVQDFRGRICNESPKQRWR